MKLYRYHPIEIILEFQTDFREDNLELKFVISPISLQKKKTLKVLGNST